MRFWIASRVPVVSWCISAILFPPQAPAQETLSWEDFEPCSPCDIQFRERARVGERDGEGIIESEIARIDAGPGRGYLVHGSGSQGGVRFHWFDPEGNHLRTIGREGEGPGEFSQILGLHFKPNGSIVALDRNRRWITFNDEGEVLADVRTRVYPAGHSRVLTDTTAVVAALGSEPHNAGYPLHLVHTQTGEELKHFGRTPEAWRSRGGMDDVIILGSAPDSSDDLWWSRPRYPRFEHWSADGQHLRTIQGSLPWLPPVEDNDFPGTVIEGHAYDDGHLYILSHHPTDDWEEVTPAVQEEGGGYTPDQFDELYDFRLDIPSLPG